MARVTAGILGGTVSLLEASTVGDVKSQLEADGYTATVNEDVQGDDYTLENGDFVSLAAAVKGGC